MNLLSAQRASQSYFTYALFHRNQHDVHYSNAADAQRQCSDEREQHFQADGNGVYHRTKLIAAEHLYGFGVSGREVLASRHCRQHLRHGFLFKLRGYRRKDHDRAISGVPEIAGGGVRNPRGLVVAGKIIAHLNFALHHADYGESHASNGDRLSDCRSSAEQLLANSAAKKDDPAALDFIGCVNPTAFGGYFVAHLTIFGANATNGGGAHHAVSVRDAGTSNGFKASGLHQGRGGFDHVDVGLLKHNFLSGALPAGLFAGLLRPANNHAFAERIESAHQDVAKTAAIGDQQRNRCDAPHDSQHGQECASVVALQRNPGFENDFGKHKKQRSVTSA